MSLTKDVYRLTKAVFLCRVGRHARIISACGHTEVCARCRDHAYGEECTLGKKK